MCRRSTNHLYDNRPNRILVSLLPEEAIAIFFVLKIIFFAYHWPAVHRYTETNDRTSDLSTNRSTFQHPRPRNLRYRSSCQAVSLPN